MSMPMSYQILVDNIKCGGCANSIRKQLTQLDGVSHVEVIIDSGTVNITGDAGQREQVIKTLRKLGYPETGSVQGLEAAGAKAKSYIACAAGRLTSC